MDERNDSDLLDNEPQDGPFVGAVDIGENEAESDDEALEVGENEDHILEEGRRLLAAAEAKLASVERALQRLDSGSYGMCEVCGAPIPAAALTERPSMARCPEHDQPVS